MHDIAQEQPRTNCRACVLAGWMLKAAAASVFIGTAVVSTFFTITSARGAPDLTMLPFIFLGVGMWAVIGVFCVVALIAFPVRLFWKRPLSLGFTTVGCALAGGLIYGSPTLLWLYQTDVSQLIMGEGHPVNVIDVVLPTLLIGTLYGAIFGYVYGRLEVHGRQVPGL